MAKKNKPKFRIPFVKKAEVQKTYHKILIYVIITNTGEARDIMRQLWELGSNAQFVCLGRGTAKKEALNMLGLESNKDVMLAFVDETNVKEISKTLSKYFAENKRVMGIGFTIPLTSIVGEKVYSFLTNTL